MGRSRTGIRFGSYELRANSRELYKLGMKLKLRPQPFQVLNLLLDRAGEVVTREQLRQELWPSDTFVDFEHSLNTAIKELRAVLDDSASNPRYVETLPKLGYRFIHPVEAPAATEPEISAAFPAPASAPSTPLPAPQPVAARNWAWGSIATAVLLILAITFVLFRLGLLFHRSPGGSTSAALKPRPSIAVLGFKNLSNKPTDDWMSTAMAEMLGAELASGQQIRVIPSENIAHMKLDLTLAPADTFGQATLSQIHDNLGTDMIASGSYLALSDGSKTKLRIVLQVQDTRTGETIAAITEDGSEVDLPQLVSSGSDELRRTLGVGTLSAPAAREARASIPANAEAERLYAEGLADLQRFDALAARAAFEKAIAADPNHALSHSALSETLARLGYDSLAQEEARKALDLSSNLSRENKLSIQGRYQELTHNRDAALATYRTLYNFFPDSLDYGLRLAGAEILSGHPADALQTISALRKLPSPSGNDPGIDLEESSAAERLGDMVRSQKAAAAAIARANKLGSRLLLAKALVGESWAWSNLGDYDKSIDDETRAREIHVAVGDTFDATIETLGIGISHQKMGDLPGARKSYEDALAEFQNLGAQWEIASCSNHLGELFQEMGDLDKASASFEQALRIHRSLNDKRGTAAVLDNLSTVKLPIGQVVQAQQMKEESLKIFQEIGDKRGASIAMTNLGEVLFQRGDLAGAKQKFVQSLADKRALSYKSGVGYALIDLAIVQTAGDDLKDALSSAQESLTIREEIKQQVYSAESEVELADIAIEQSRPADAEALARKAISVLDKEKAIGSSTRAYVELARSLLAGGKLQEAEMAAEHAGALAQQGSDRILSATAALVQAEVATRSGKSSESERSLRALSERLSHDGYLALTLDARLLLAQAELQSGRSSLARADLAKLQSTARSSGFLLIARKASASLTQAH